MQKKHIQAMQIASEHRNISKYAGLFFSRMLLLICLFFLLVVLRPVSLYIFVFVAFFPWIFSNFLVTEQNSPEIILDSCAKKYFFTPVKLTAEKCTGNSTVFLLVIWQLSLNPETITIEVLKLAPSFLLLTYLISRILITIIVRRKIHKYYVELTILD